MDQPNDPTPPQLDLDVQMTLAKEFIEHIEVDNQGIGGAPRAVLRFSLGGKIQDTQRREEMLVAYRGALEESVPELVTRLGFPVVLDPKKDGEDHYSKDLQQAVEEAMTHIRAVFEGTHRWSPLLAEDLPDDPEHQDLVFSGCQVGLVGHFEPTGAADANEEPERELRMGFMFVALLFDMTDVRPNDTVYALDTDPRPSNRGD